jgi:hypothetical protein
MKISSKFRREFEFYVQYPKMIGTVVSAGLEQQSSSNTDSTSALEAFYALDSYGKRLPCAEPEILAAAIAGKASVNLQVKMWAEGLAEATFTAAELREYCVGYPQWVYKAIVNQAKRLALAHIGFVPTYVTL